MSIDNRISLQKLQVFERVVVLGGVGRAAQDLGVAQPVITEHVRSLERRLGIRLFAKEGRSLILTEGGRLVYAWCSDVIRRTRLLDRDLKSLSSGSLGSIVIGTSMSIGSYELPAVMSSFGLRRPQVRIRVDIQDAERAIECTAAGSNDLSVVVVQDPPVRDKLVADRIGSDELVIVAPPQGLVGEVELSASDLALLPFVEAQEGSLRRQFVEKQFSALGLPPRKAVMEFGHPEAMKRAVAQGLGLACLFRSAVRKELAAGELREVQVTGLRLSGPVWLIQRNDRTLSPVHNELIDDIRRYFAGRA